MPKGVYRVKPKVKIVQRTAKQVQAASERPTRAARIGGYVRGGTSIAAGMVADTLRQRQVNKVTDKMDKMHLTSHEKRAHLKAQEQRQNDGAGVTEDRLNEYVLAVGKALLKPAAKMVAPVAKAGGGKIARAMGKVKGGKAAAWMAGKARNVKVARRAQHIKNIRYARTKPVRAGIKKAVKTIGAESGMRTSVELATHAAKNPMLAKYDKMAGTPDQYSNINRIRSDQGGSSGAARSIPDAKKGPAHTQSNAHMAIRRSEMKSPTPPARQPTRQRTNVSASVIDTAANIFENYYLPEVIAAASALTTQMKFANKRIAKPIAKAITKPFIKDDVEEAIPVADLVAVGHVRPLRKYSKKGARAIVNRGIAPAAEKLANKGWTPGHRPVRTAAKATGKGIGRVASSTGRKAMSAGRKTGTFAKKKYGQLRAKVKKQNKQALAHAKKMDKSESRLDEIMATTVIGGAAVGAAAARRLAHRNVINRKIYSKKAAKRTAKAQDYEARAKIAGAFRTGGRKYTQQRLQAKAGKVQKKIDRFPVNDSVDEGTGYSASRATRHEISSKQWALWAKRADKEGKESSTRLGKGLSKVRGKVATYMSKGHKREGKRWETMLKAKSLGTRKKYRQLKREKRQIGEGLIFTSPERWQKKARKQRMKAAKAQATSDVFARRTRRGLQKKLGRIQRKADRYGGTEKFGQNPKKKISGKSAAQIVAGELERRHNLYGEGTENSFNLAQYRITPTISEKDKEQPSRGRRLARAAIIGTGTGLALGTGLATGAHLIKRRQNKILKTMSNTTRMVS